MNKRSNQAESTVKPSGEQPDFENALAELEALVGRLEKGELSLDESLEQFKRGVELTRRCQKILDEAQQVIEQLNNIEDESSSVPVDPAD
jgi:exodeoxyribonuclease VII small subunit